MPLQLKKGNGCGYGTITNWKPVDCECIRNGMPVASSTNFVELKDFCFIRLIGASRHFCTDALEATLLPLRDVRLAHISSGFCMFYSVPFYEILITLPLATEYLALHPCSQTLLTPVVCSMHAINSEHIDLCTCLQHLPQPNFSLKHRVSC